MYTLFENLDGDGYGDSLSIFTYCDSTLQGAVSNGDDCDDMNPDINPDAEEILDNGVDEDCDGMDLVSSVYNLGSVRLRIYPNPAIDQVTISTEGNTNYKADLMNQNGKQLWTAHNPTSVSLHNIPAGIYLLRITDTKTNTSIVERIVKH